jgi:hypothetical protein
MAARMSKHDDFAEAGAKDCIVPFCNDAEEDEANRESGPVHGWLSPAGACGAFLVSSDRGR